MFTLFNIGKPIFRHINNLPVTSENIGTTYKTITINKTYVPTTQTNCVIMLKASLLGAGFFTALGSGGSPRFTLSDGVTQLPYEKVYLSTGSSKGYYKILVPTVNGTASGSSTDIRVYYSNSLSDLAVDHSCGRNAVWANNYKIVQHLQTTPDLVQTNSTGNSAYDMTSFAAISSAKVTTAGYGEGNAHVYDSTSAGFKTSSPVSAYPFTMGCLFRTPNNAEDESNIIGLTDADSTSSCTMRKFGLKSTKLLYAGMNLSITDAANYSGVGNTSWNLGVAIFESSTSRKVYFNNNTAGTNAASYTYPAGLDTFCLMKMDMGTDQLNSFTWNIQDVFFMDSVMSADRITTLYNNYFQASFFTIT